MGNNCDSLLVTSVVGFKEPEMVSVSESMMMEREGGDRLNPL